MSLMAAPSKAKSAQLFADISDNQTTYSARAYASAGHLMIAIKATQGLTFISPDWSSRVQDSHREKLAVLHYHYAQLDDATLEARHFWETVRPHYKPHFDRIAVDLEIGNSALWPAWLSEFDREITRLSGLWVDGYTFASGITPELKLKSGRWWVASWGSDRPAGRRLKLPNGQRLWAWQYEGGLQSPSGGPRVAAGIGVCDMSVMREDVVRNLRRQRSGSH